MRNLFAFSVNCQSVRAWSVVGALAVGVVGWGGVPSIAAAASSITYSYDALGRLITVQYGNGTIIQYSYDSAGNRTQVVSNAPAGGQSGGGYRPIVVVPLLGGLVIPINIAPN